MRITSIISAFSLSSSAGGTPAGAHTAVPRIYLEVGYLPDSCLCRRPVEMRLTLRDSRPRSRAGDRSSGTCATDDRHRRDMIGNLAGTTTWLRPLRPRSREGICARCRT
jgi:hypothetical protein